MTARSVLATRNLSKVYNQRSVVSHVTLQIENGMVVGLLGPNGAGKTTTFYSIVGFIRPTGGFIYLDGENITTLPIHQRAARGITYLAQEPSVFKKLTVRENVRIVLEPLGLSRNEINNRIDELMAELKIEYLADNKGHALSGGERRRVEIMRALATRPRFILLDEPFAGVDPLSVADLQKIIRDLRETLQVCDFAYIMNDGQILTCGAANDIIESKVARRMYLGDNFHM